MANYIYDLVQQCIKTSSTINIVTAADACTQTIEQKIENAGLYTKQLSHLFELIKNEYPIYYEVYKYFCNNKNFSKDEYRWLIEVGSLLFLLEKEEKGKNRRKIFISHSSKDKDVVENFTKNILRSGMGISDEDIFCTSNVGTDIQTGEDIRKHIKENLKYCDYVFLMISKNYNESVVCLNEMGAAWVLDKQVKPLLLPETTIEKDLGWIFHTNIASKIEERATLDKLYDELCKRYSIEKKAENWGRDAESFLQCLKTSQEIK
jgi:phage anti-repressor protein